MTTDTRTNEQIVQDRLTMMPENERAYVAAKAVEVLRTAGRLAGEPNEAQVEAAAEGMWDRYGDRGMFQHAAEHLRSAFRKDARAALVAAAEAAPVQPSSTVDEDALAEMISNTDSMVRIWYDESDLMRESAKIARAVAEWLTAEQEGKKNE